MIEVHSWQDEGTGETKLVFYQRTQGQSRAVFNLYTGKMHEVKIGEQIPADFIFTIPWNWAQEVEQALANWLARKGIRNDHDARLEGTLEATRYHLEDLRAMLHLDYENNRPLKSSE